MQLTNNFTLEGWRMLFIIYWWLYSRDVLFLVGSVRVVLTEYKIFNSQPVILSAETLLTMRCFYSQSFPYKTLLV